MNAFLACIYEQMERKGFGKARADKVAKRFEGLSEYYRRQGVADPELSAMTQAFNELHEEISERAKRSLSDVIGYADAKARFDEALSRNKTMLPSRVAIAFVEHQQSVGGLSYEQHLKTTRGQIWSVMNDVLDKVGKGAFGTQRGKAHLENIVDEIFGKDTKDLVAKEVAKAWRATADAGVDLFNLAGSSLRKLNDWRLPQRMNAAKLVRAGEKAFVDAMNDALDWSRMSWPDGMPIETAAREGVLKEVFATLKTGGATKIDPGKFTGRGAAIGNQLAEHRFLHFKDADAWKRIHNQFGDGNVFDVMTSHLESMTHEIALIKTFGTNPARRAEILKALALSKAAAIDKATTEPQPGLVGGAKRTVTSKTEAELKNIFNPMFERVTRTNPMDPESIKGSLVTGTANILTSAQLGAAFLLAMPGDFATMANVASFNHLGGFNPLSTYLKAIATDIGHQRAIAGQSGFIMDEVIASNYTSARFLTLNTYGPQVTRRIADTVLRASYLAKHTVGLRWAVQSEFMGLLARSRGKAFGELPFTEMMQRYGITADDWNAFRENVQNWQPRPDVNFLRPIDLLKTSLKQKDDLFHKFQGMIFQESRHMIPEGTIESNVRLKGNTRPDTLPGAILHSFSMYKSFPMAFWMQYGRLAMTRPDWRSRIGFVAGLGASMVFAGALGVQMRELTQGRDPLPMNTGQFLGKALLASGGMSIWGDFLFQGINQFGSGPEDVAAGPIVSALGDTTQLLLGDAFQWAGALGTLNQGDTHAKFPQRLVSYARRYTPGTSLWFARLALQRQVFDRLEELADPRAYQKRQRRATQQRKVFGNQSYWPAGSRTPQRTPDVTGAFGQ